MQGKVILQCHQLCLCVFLKQSFLRETTNTCIMNKNSLRPPQHSEIFSTLTVLAWSKSHPRRPVLSSQLQALLSLHPGLLRPTQSQAFPAKAAFLIALGVSLLSLPLYAQLIIRLADCSFTEPLVPVPLLTGLHHQKLTQHMLSRLHMRSLLQPPFWSPWWSLIWLLALHPSAHKPHEIPLNVAWFPIFYCVSSSTCFSRSFIHGSYVS